MVGFYKKGMLLLSTMLLASCATDDASTEDAPNELDTSVNQEDSSDLNENETDVDTQDIPITESSISATVDMNDWILDFTSVEVLNADDFSVDFEQIPVLFDFTAQNMHPTADRVLDIEAQVRLNVLDGDELVSELRPVYEAGDDLEYGYTFDEMIFMPDQSERMQFVYDVELNDAYTYQLSYQVDRTNALEGIIYIDVTSDILSSNGGS